MKKRPVGLGYFALSAAALLSCCSVATYHYANRVTFVGVEYKAAAHGATGEWWLPSPGGSFDRSILTNCDGATTCILKIPSDMRPPISIYFNIGPFYENYLDYVKTSDYQNNSFASDIAYRTFFNDTFEIGGANVSEDNIAWSTDLDFIGDWNDESVSSLFASREIANQHLAVWMRPSAFPECFKLYGRIDHALRRDEELFVVIHDRYPGANLHKRLWITDWRGGSLGIGWARWLMAGSTLAFLNALLAAYPCIQAILRSLRVWGERRGSNYRFYGVPLLP